MNLSSAVSNLTSGEKSGVTKQSDRYFEQATKGKIAIDGIVEYLSLKTFAALSLCIPLAMTWITAVNTAVDTHWFSVILTWFGLAEREFFTVVVGVLLLIALKYTGGFKPLVVIFRALAWVAVTAILIVVIPVGLNSAALNTINYMSWHYSESNSSGSSALKNAKLDALDKELSRLEERYDFARNLNPPCVSKHSSCAANTVPADTIADLIAVVNEQRFEILAKDRSSKTGVYSVLHSVVLRFDNTITEEEVVAWFSAAIAWFLVLSSVLSVPMLAMTYNTASLEKQCYRRAARNKILGKMDEIGSSIPESLGRVGKALNNQIAITTDKVASKITPSPVMTSSVEISPPAAFFENVLVHDPSPDETSKPVLSTEERESTEKGDTDTGSTKVEEMDSDPLPGPPEPPEEPSETQEPSEPPEEQPETKSEKSQANKPQLDDEDIINRVYFLRGLGCELTGLKLITYAQRQLIDERGLRPHRLGPKRRQRILSAIEL